MASRPVALLLADLGIAKSHSRPHTSNDNPYSEAHFKILKYRPGFPARFGSIEDARAFCQRFFPWYNTEHRHSGIGLMTPAIVHAGLAPEVQGARAITLSQACVSPGLTGSGSRVPDPAGHLRLSAPETFDAAERGDVTIGGCMPDLPVERSCPTCGLTTEWASRWVSSRSDAGRPAAQGSPDLNVVGSTLSFSGGVAQW